jgi:hypothetical protein
MKVTPRNPCSPNPCGPGSVCKVQNRKPVCSCAKNYFGDAKQGCTPQCVVNSDCKVSEACDNHVCVNPCSKEPCGINADCRVIEHRPVCTCGKDLIGDPLIQCHSIPTRNMTRDPCDPSPCGPNVPCYTYSNNIAICDECSAFDGQCRRQCSYDSECPTHLSCLASMCRDPCVGVCGHNTNCEVYKT